MTPEEIRDKLRGQVEGAELQAGPGDAFLMVPSEDWHEAATLLARDPGLSFGFLRALSGVDRPATGKIEVVCHLLSYEHRHAIVLKTTVPRSGGELPTLSDVWPAAEWHERELFDLFGVKLAGHPDLRRILLPDDWVGHPLLKDYVEPDSYNGIPMRRPARGEAAEVKP